MSDTNKHGLSRVIGSEIQRTIRRNSGFGCVICGKAIGEYEHVDPPFSDAVEHDPRKMTFLCLEHHGRVTKGWTSKQEVLEAMKAPKALQKGYSREAFGVGDGPLQIKLGPTTATDCECLIRVDERPVLWINPPEESGGPYRLNAELRDEVGHLILQIVDNEWRSPSDNWDVTVVGQRITIRNAPRDIALQIRTEPPHTLVIERLNMRVNGVHFLCDNQEFYVRTPAGHKFYAQDLEVNGPSVLFDVMNDGMSVGVNAKGARFSGRMDFGPGLPIRRRANQSRNSRCECGSGKRFKRCCGSFGL